MSGVLLDLADRLAGGDSEDGAITTEISEINDFLPHGGNNETIGQDELDDSFCSVPEEFFDNFAAEEFSNTRIISWMHSIPPRFGHTKNVLDLMVGTEAQQQDYVKGLFAPASALLVFFFVWGFALLVFKLLAPTTGSNSIRWLAGQQLRMPSPPMGSNKDDRHYDSRKGNTPEFREWKQEFSAARYQMFVFKTIVWVAGLSITIAALVMSVYGVDSLTNTLEAGRESIKIVRTLAADAQSIVDSVINQNRDLSQKVYGMLEEVNRMCPLVRDPLCDNIYNISTCNITSFLGSDLNEVFQMAAGHFADGDESEYFMEIVNAKNGLKDVELVSKDIDHSAAQLSWALSLSMILSLLLAMLSILILCGLICPEVPKVLQCIRSKFMIPTFVVLVVFAYFFCLVFVTASVATADICVYHNETDNIDERLTALLTGSETLEELLGGTEYQNLVVEFISFYIHQCPVEMLPNEILEQLQYVQAGVPVVQQFGTIVEDSTELIRGVCGFGADQTQGLVSVADTLQDQMCSLVAILTDVRDFVQCGNWYPLYETTVYEALCYDGTEGFAYVASTQFVIVFMAFLILTCRVAFWEIQIGDEFFDFVSENGSSWRSRGSSEEMEETDSLEHGGFSYYKKLRRKLGFRSSPPPSSSGWSASESGLSETMEEEMGRQHQKQRQQGNILGRNLKGGWFGNASLSRTATAATSSWESQSREDRMPLQLTPPPPRNSIYPSRRINRAETTAVSPNRTAVVGNTTALEFGEDGIEVVEHYKTSTNNNRDKNNFRSRYNSYDSRTGNVSRASSCSNSILCKSRSVDSTSLWMKHRDNIEYVDSDDEDYGSYSGSGNYSYGDDWSSRDGGT